MARGVRRAAVVGLTAVLAALALLAADAASLGSLTPHTLASFDVSATATTPAIVGCDNFTGTTGSSLNGRAVTVAANCSSRTWAVNAGGWTIQANQAASNSTANAVATLNTSSNAATATVTLSGLTSGQVGGVVIDHNGGVAGLANFLVAVITVGAPSRIDLRVFTLGLPLTVATNSGITIAPTNTLSLTRAGSAITVRLNGTTVLTYTLTATDILNLGGGRAGVIGGTTATRFDDFVVTVP